MTHPCKYEWATCTYPPVPGRAYCGPHLEPPHPHGIGYGTHTDTYTVETPQHRDRGYTALRCDQCNATWVGPLHEPCPWCITSHHHTIEWQAELVLTAPDHPTSDNMRTWAQRLHRAVQADIITDHQARNTWKRAQR